MKIKRFCAMFLTIMIMATMHVGITHAATTKKTIDLPANYAFSKDKCEGTRTKKYTFVIAQCISVYPPNGGKDNFTTIQVMLKNESGKQISGVRKLSEKNAGMVDIEIREGYLNTSKVKFCFRGNSEAAAKARVAYDPL